MINALNQIKNRKLVSIKEGKKLNKSYNSTKCNSCGFQLVDLIITELKNHRKRKLSNWEVGKPSIRRRASPYLQNKYEFGLIL